MSVSKQSVDPLVIPEEKVREALGRSNKECDRAFSELAAFLLSQYKKKKQGDLVNEPNIDNGQIDNNVT